MRVSAYATTDFLVARSGLLDLLAIQRQQRACFGTDAYDLITLFSLAVTPGTVNLKATHNGALVGYIAAEINRNDHCGWIVTVGVQPEFTGRGIATALLLSVEKQLAMPTMRLTVRSHNQRAITLYERLGYRWCGTHRRYYRDGEDGLMMEKSVIPA
jgi:ribosomal protein S18 acetylase RimI-like enzyme